MKFRHAALFLGTLSLAISLPATAADKKLKGLVKLDGSSTVFPVAEAAAEEFGKEFPRVRVTVGLSGSGGGFEKFVKGEIDISNASRPIKAKEIEKAKENNIEYFELAVAYDGISVVSNPKNTFATELTMEQLKKIWEPGSKIKNWSQLNPKWPAHEIKLYGPGPDSGTFDFFTEEVMGKARASRSDYVASEDDNVLVTGVSADEGAIGYFGYAYYIANKDKLNLIKLDAGKGPILPTHETIEKATYPLSRPLLIYVNLKAAQKPEVYAFIEFLINNAGKLAEEVGYISLPEETYKTNLARFKEAVKSASAKSH